MSIFDFGSRVRVRRKSAGDVEIIAPARGDKVRIRLSRDATSLQFFQALYRNPKMMLRVAAAERAIPYEHPKLVAVIDNRISPQDLKVVITGGLPKLPGTQTSMPFEDRSPPLTPAGVDFHLRGGDLSSDLIARLHDQAPAKLKGNPLLPFSTPS
jgi:hypothetical protein